MLLNIVFYIINSEQSLATECQKGEIEVVVVSGVESGVKVALESSSCDVQCWRKDNAE